MNGISITKLKKLLAICAELEKKDGNRKGIESMSKDSTNIKEVTKEEGREILKEKSKESNSLEENKLTMEGEEEKNKEKKEMLILGNRDYDKGLCVSEEEITLLHNVIIEKISN